MNAVNVFVATGLGYEVGDYFYSSLRSKLTNHSSIFRPFPRFVDANCVLPVLQDSKQIAKILLHSLLNPSCPLPSMVMIPCNTVHIATPHLKKVFGNRFFPIDEAVLELITRERKKGRFLILGTSTTVESCMYHNGLNRLACEAVTLPADAQKKLDHFIFNDLLKGPMSFSHLKELRDIELHYKNLLNADYVILACTELCYLVQMFSKPLDWEIDSMQALLDMGIERLQNFSKIEALDAY